jgi:hypothetical protein
MFDGGFSWSFLQKCRLIYFCSYIQRPSRLHPQQFTREGENLASIHQSEQKFTQNIFKIEAMSEKLKMKKKTLLELRGRTAELSAVQRILQYKILAILMEFAC